MGKYYGVDVGGTTVKIGFFQDGVLREKWEIPTDVTDGGRNILPDIAAAMPFPADGAAIAVPGAVLPDGTVNRCVNLGWGVCRPGDGLAALTGIPCRVCNDANAAAMGELWQGAGAGFDSILLVTLGTGVGAGVASRGEIVFGAHGAAGELGHICVEPEETERCTCGNYGCLEQYGGGGGIARLAAKAGLAGATAKDVFSLAAAGDERASAVADRACGLLGRGVAAACAVIDPAAVVLGGGVSRAGEPLRLRVEEAFRKYAFHACRDTPVLLAALGADAGIYGGARFAMEPGRE